MDDAALLAACQDGDRAALGTLLERHQDRLFNVCLRMVSNRDDALEVCQDAMLKIVEHIDGYRGDSKLTTWMTRIAMNASISHLRKRRIRRHGSLEATANGDPGGDERGSDIRSRLEDEGEPEPGERVQTGEMLEHLSLALDRVDDQFRSVLVLRDIEEMDYAQIAETLDLPIGTVKSRLFRARLALRQEMEKAYPAELASEG